MEFDQIPIILLTLKRKTGLRCVDMPPLSAEELEKLAVLQHMMQAQN